MNLSKAEFKFDEWAKYADEDQKMAEIALKEDGPPNQICFHSQQIAEKYLKGYLVFSGKEFEKSHLLRYLLELCEEIDLEFRELENDVVYLTQFYTETRYPGDIPEFNLPECREAFEASLRIKEFILSKIKFSKAESGFGLLGIVVAVAVFVAVAIGGGFYFKETQKQKSLMETGREAEKKMMEVKSGRPATNDQQPTTDDMIDTSTWKTYRNEKYGFEVKYPYEIQVKDYNEGGVYERFVDRNEKAVISNGPLGLVGYTGWSLDKTVESRIINSVPGAEKLNIISRQNINGNPSFIYIEGDLYTILGSQGIVQAYFISEERRQINQTNYKAILFSLENPQYKDVFKNMLLTFRFTK